MDKEKAKFIAGLVDKLMAALQDMPHKVDERLLAICRKVKSEVLSAAAGGDYPQPSPDEAQASANIDQYDPVMEGIKSRIQSFEEKMADIEKRLDEIGPTLEATLAETIKAAAEQLVTDKFGDIEKELGAQSEVVANFVELLDALRPQLGLPAREQEEVKSEEIKEEEKTDV